jgi:hypothetical protein
MSQRLGQELTSQVFSSKYHTFMILLQNYAGDRQKSSKTTIMKMFVKLDKAKSNTGNTNGLN